MDTDPVARIFNIQKFSIHDGPGVRTTVFFKGCPLRCFWCSNPESINPDLQVLWDKKACIGCGCCAAACPAAAITMTDARPVFDYKRCTACSRCFSACPHQALSMAGKQYAVDDVVAVCLEDRLFYEDSGGGVTLSGGEVMMQPRFVSELLQRLRAENIHTALETNGFADAAIFSSVAANADLLLFDVKHYDEEKHRRGTGVSNQPILRNLAQALAMKIPLLVRIPVIRSYSNSLEDAIGFARLLVGLGIREAQLLPFHQMGESKYAMLGAPYRLAKAKALHKEDLEDFKQMLLIQGMEKVIL